MRNKFHNFVQQLLNFYADFLLADIILYNYAVVSTTLFTQLIFKFLGLIFANFYFVSHFITALSTERRCISMRNKFYNFIQQLLNFYADFLLIDFILYSMRLYPQL